MTDLNLPTPATEEDWAALNSFGGEFGGPAKRCLLDLRARLEAVEARLPWIGTAADVAPQVVSITTADGLSPVEPAPQAQQGVTVEELACILSEAPSGDLGAAYWLLKHPRLGPLLRGVGAPAPARVVLPERPNNGPALYELLRTRDQGCFLAGWAAARAEVERQQGGQAAPEPDAQPEPNQAPAADHIPAATKMVPAGDGEREELVDRLGWIAAQLADIGWEGDSASVARAAALLRQPAPEGLVVKEYVHLDSGARIKQSGGCWVVRNSRHVSPFTVFPTVAAALAALEPPQGGEVAP